LIFYYCIEKNKMLENVTIIRSVSKNGKIL